MSRVMRVVQHQGSCRHLLAPLLCGARLAPLLQRVLQYTETARWEPDHTRISQSMGEPRLSAKTSVQIRRCCRFPKRQTCSRPDRVLYQNTNHAVQLHRWECKTQTH
mmetsp:Transcript_1642/g.3571  ORF Transcript_1642/g.3571 Transcript_1642/m.3571 type:complete len:107 (+) Transcript_1642:1032-1352(+)